MPVDFFYYGFRSKVGCGNQLLQNNNNNNNRENDSGFSSLSDLPVPLHAFFHITSALGPYYWLTFAIYKDLYINKKRKVNITYPINCFSLGVRLPVVEASVKQV